MDAYERVRSLARIDEVLHDGKMIYPFRANRNLVRARLKSEIIFIKDEEMDFYLTFGTAKNGDHFYPETFFLRYDQDYIKGQQSVHVERLHLT